MAIAATSVFGIVMLMSADANATPGVFGKPNAHKPGVFGKPNAHEPGVLANPNPHKPGNVIPWKPMPWPNPGQNPDPNPGTKPPHWHVHVHGGYIYYSAPIATGTVAQPNSCTCLTKEYTQEGAVLLKDPCTNEAWINPPAVAPAAQLQQLQKTIAE